MRINGHDMSSGEGNQKQLACIIATPEALGGLVSNQHRLADSMDAILKAQKRLAKAQERSTAIAAGFFAIFVLGCIALAVARVVLWLM